MGYPMLGGLTNLWDGHLDDLVVNGIGGVTILQKSGNELVGYFPEKNALYGVFLEVRTTSGLIETYAMVTQRLSTERIGFSLPTGLWEALATRTDVASVLLYTRFAMRGDVLMNTLMGSRGGVASFRAGTIFKNDTEAPKSVASFDDGSFTNFADGAYFSFVEEGKTRFSSLQYVANNWYKLGTTGGISKTTLETEMVPPGNPLYFFPKYAAEEATTLALEDGAAMEAAEAKEERLSIIPVYR